MATEKERERERGKGGKSKNKSEFGKIGGAGDETWRRRKKEGKKYEKQSIPF